MYYNKRIKSIFTWSIMVSFIFCLSVPLFTTVHSSLGQENYIYYCVVPSKIYRYILNDYNAGGSDSWMNLNSGWIMAPSNANYLEGSLGLQGLQIATKSLLAIVAAEDGTNVKVYDQLNGSLLSEKNINSMEKHLVLLANGTHFKVVSNKIVSVLLLNYQEFPSDTVVDGPISRTFYTDVNGLYVGKEFVLMASEQSGAESGGVSSQVGAFYAILAIEKAAVTVTKDDGTVLTTFTIDANSYKFIALNSFSVYKIESSTGNIMVQSGTIPGKFSTTTLCFAVPSVDGGFVGTAFYTRSWKSQEAPWDSMRDYGFRITALEDTKVRVWNLETKELIREISVTGGSGTAIQPEAFAIAVLSDKPITLIMLHNGSIEQTTGAGGGKYASYGRGVMFIGIQPNEDTIIHLPTNAYVEAYFFTSETTQLVIDGYVQTIQADSSLLYTVPGTHTIQCDHNVVVQINFWPLEPECQGLWYTGAAIPCIETVNNNPTATLTPIEGFPMTYVIIGVAVASVVVIVGLLIIRNRR